MRGWHLTLGLLVLASLLAPAALGTQAVQVKSPVRGVQLLPQLGCAIVYDAPGAQRCDVLGAVARVDELRVTILGAGQVFALADDTSNPAAVVQLATLQCNFGTCAIRFPPSTTPSAALYVYTSGAAGTTIDASLHTFGAGTG